MVGGHASDTYIDALYLEQIPVEIGQVPRCEPSSHTMGFELDAYVSQRLPSKRMVAALHEVDEVHLHGISPAHFPQIADRFGYSELQALPPNMSANKSANGSRPRAFVGRCDSGARCLCIAVMPGRDYVVHYTSLMLHHLAGRWPVSAWRYPVAEETITQWTGLTGLLDDLGGQTVIAGKTDLLVAHMSLGRTELRHDTPYYSVERHLTPAGQRVTLLATHYSHWGEMSGPITRALCEAGAREVIYVGKLGTFTSPRDLYSRVFVPSSYAVMRGENVVVPTFSVPNRVLEALPTLDTGLHVSVPTVVEESCRQRHVATTIGAASIDNEIAHMALTVRRWNDSAAGDVAGDVAFSALHYASDYLRGLHETRRRVPLTLATGRTASARMAREVMSRFLAMYLETHLASLTSSMT